MQKHPIDPGEYRFLRTRPGANPYAIEFKSNKWFQYPLMINGRRAHSDVDGPFTRALTETSSADRDLFVAKMASIVFRDERCTYPDKESIRLEAEDDVRKLTPQNSFEAPAKRGWTYPSLRN